MKRNKKHQWQGQWITLAKSEFTEQWKHKKINTNIMDIMPLEQIGKKNKVKRIQLLCFNQQVLKQTNMWKSMLKEKTGFGHTLLMTKQTSIL